MKILGLSGSTHDSAAALIIDSELVGAIEEERISRSKHAVNQLPIGAANELFKMAGITGGDIDLVAYFLDQKKFNQEAWRHILWGDPGRYLFHPITYEIKRFLARGQRYFSQADKLVQELGINSRIVFIPHHLAHAASAFYLSPFEKAMILTIDNMGEIDSTQMALGTGTAIKILHKQNIPHSLGMLYAVITQYLGFKPWDEEGKIMALAAYGQPIIPREKIVNLKGDNFFVKKPFQMIQTKDKFRIFSDELIKKFGPAREPTEPIEQRHKNIAASIQFVVEETAKYLVERLYSKTTEQNLCLAGGVALNCKMNKEISSLPFIKNIYVTPAAGDAGASLGAAVYAAVAHYKTRPKPLLSVALGREFSEEKILNCCQKSGLQYKRLDNITKETAVLLVKEKIICWFQGRSEFGPRALGQRSILALPQFLEIKNKLNTEIKHREEWRPLCPSVLASESKKYFCDNKDGLFMNVATIATDFAKQRIPGVLHVDGTARIQKVFPEKLPLYADLLMEVGKLTSDPVLLNTSFNSRGEPIVDSPQDAIDCFKRLAVHSLIMGNYLLWK